MTQSIGASSGEDRGSRASTEPASGLGPDGLRSPSVTRDDLALYLITAANARAKAYIESCHNQRRVASVQDYADSTRSEALTMSMLFWALAKGAVSEAEALRALNEQGKEVPAPDLRLHLT